MAGSNPFRKKSVPQAVRDEITKRQGKSGIEWTAQRFPWISVTSMSSECDTKYTQLTSLKGDLYEERTGINAYQRPNPVITGLDVKKQGELGTTRKATLKITAFTDTQLRELQKCYFIPGMSVRIEWGWSLQSKGFGYGLPLGSERSFPDTFVNSLMKARTKSYPVYEGLQGMVANFSYGLTKDNYWECSVEVISAAEAFGSTKVNTYDCPECVSKHKGKEGEEDSVEQDSTLYKFFKDLFEDYDLAVSVYTDALNKVAAIDGKKATIAQYNFNAAGRDENGGDASSWYEGSILGVTVNQPDTTDPFITWSTFEAAVNLLSVKTSSEKYVFGRLTSKDMPLTYFDCISCYNNQYATVTSADPRICILPGVTFNNFLATQKAGPAPESCVFTDDNGVKCIKLDNILLNTVTLMLELKNVESNGDGSLRTYVTNVLNKVNDACGELWAFEVLSTSSDDEGGTEKYPTITVIDAKKYTPSPADVYVLTATPTDSVIRDFKLDMKMTESMKSQALYANGNQQPAATTNAGGSCGGNALKGFRVLGKGEVTNLAHDPKTDPKDCSKCKETNKGEKVPTFQELVLNVREDVTDSTTNALKSALKNAYASALNKGDDKHCAGMILPFEFSFTIDGIGGFAFGQMVSCNRIPEEVRNAYDFQVTSVEHSVSPNDWTTTVNTVCRYKPK